MTLSERFVVYCTTGASIPRLSFFLSASLFRLVRGKRVFPASFSFNIKEAEIASVSLLEDRLRSGWS